MLRYGLEVAETVSSDLPGVPNAVWTVKLSEDGESISFLLFARSRCEGRHERDGRRNEGES